MFMLLLIIVSTISTNFPVKDSVLSAYLNPILLN